MLYTHISFETSLSFYDSQFAVLLLAAIVGVGVGVPLAMMEDFITSPIERLTAVKKILREVPLIDG